MKGAVIFLLLSAAAGSQGCKRPNIVREVLQPAHYLDLRWYAEDTIFGRSCLGQSREQAEKWFDRQYGNRMRRVDAYFRARFSAEQLGDKRTVEDFVDAERIHLGGCITGLDGKALADPSEDEFRKRLSLVEAKITQAED